VDCDNVGLNGDAIALLILVGIIAIVAIKVFVDKFLNAGDIKGTKALKIMMKRKKVLARAKAIMGQLKILVAYFQVIISFLDVGVPFPDVFTGLFVSFSFLNIDPVKNLKGICEGTFDFYSIFLWNSFMPIVCSLLILAHYLATRPSGADAGTLRKYSAFYINLFLMLLFCIYPGTSKVVLSVFRCHSLQISDTETRAYLYADYSIECWEGSHAMYSILALVMTILYPVGVPVLFIMSIRGYSKVTADGVPLEDARKDDPDAQSALIKDPVINEQYGFLYGRFKPDFWWYETSELARKLAIGSMTMFIMPGTATQTIVAIGFNTYFLCQMLVCWPFKSYDDNMLFTLSLVATTITLFGALIIQGHIDRLDDYAPGVTTGILLGSSCTLFVLYFVILCRFQMPLICNWMMPDFIRESPLNCFKPPPKPKAKPTVESNEPATSSIAMDSLLPPPPALPPAAHLDVDEAALDQLIIEFFHRYDLDESGTINSNEELRQLSTNLSFKLRLTLRGDEIDSLVKSAGELDYDNEWQVEDFGEWFKVTFLRTHGQQQESIQGDMATVISLAQNASMQQEIIDGAGGGDGD